MCLHLLFYVNTFTPSLSALLRGSWFFFFFLFFFRCCFCCALVVRSCRPCSSVAQAVGCTGCRWPVHVGGHVRRCSRPSVVPVVAGPVRRLPRSSVAPVVGGPCPAVARAHRCTVPIGIATMRVTGGEGGEGAEGEGRRGEGVDSGDWLCPPSGPNTHLAT